MGRGKVEIKKIENTTNRQVTYSKRRNGLVKKADEISILCDSKVSLVMLANNGKMHSYHTPSTSVEDILDRYQKISGKRIWDDKHENLSNEIERVKKENDNMQTQLRHFKGEDIAGLAYPELDQLEDALDNGISSVSNKEMEIYGELERKMRMLDEEQSELKYVLHKQEMMDGYKRDDDGAVCFNPHQERHDVEDDYHYHTSSFGYRVQPMQPNLQAMDRVNIKWTH